jgi:hypothetical protein
VSITSRAPLVDESVGDLVASKKYAGEIETLML